MLRKFKFSFAKILKINEFKTREAQRHLAASLAKLYALQQHFENLRNAADRERITLKEEISSSQINKDTIGSITMFLEINALNADECRKKIAEVEIEVEEKRETLRETLKEEKKFVKLRERLFEKHQHRMNREMIKEIDEVSSRMSVAKIKEKVH